MKFLIFIFLAMVMSNSVWSSSSVTVFDVRKNLRLNEKDPVYHDYYINAGTNQGLRKGLLVNVQRRLPFKDSSLSKVQEELIVDVAELEVIHVQRSFSIARLHRSLLGKASPILDYSSIMVGDKADMGSVRSKPRKSRKSSRARKATVRLPAKNVMATVKKQQAPLLRAKAVEVPRPKMEQPILSTNQGL